MDISGQSAIVTGAASGLGAATAAMLAEAGAKVAILDVNADAALAVATKIGGLALSCDVTSADATAAAIAAAEAKHGIARIVINCAGVGPARRIVGRHGPMVLSVCRAILRDDHAAEDAFQAAVPGLRFSS